MSEKKNRVWWDWHRNCMYCGGDLDVDPVVRSNHRRVFISSLVLLGIVGLLLLLGPEYSNSLRVGLCSGAVLGLTIPRLFVRKVKRG